MQTNFHTLAMLAVIACCAVGCQSIKTRDPVIKRADIVYDAGDNSVCPQVLLAADGDLIAGWGTRGDGMPGSATQFARSKDLGKTWSKPYLTIKSDKPLTGTGIFLYNLPDGRILCYTQDLVWPSEPDGIREKLGLDAYIEVAGGRKFYNYYSFSTDYGCTFSAEKPLTDPASNPVKPMDFVQGNIVALTNGDLLWSWGDWGNPPLNGFKRSTDGGLTWGAMVRAFQDPPPGFVKPLSFNETGVAVCKDGSIVAVARVDGAPGNDKRFWQIKSSDNGKTWSTPRPIEIQGGSPALYCTPKGQLWLAYRDAGFGPGLGLAVSDDKGEHWRFLYHLKDPQGDGYEKRFGHVRYTDEDRRQPWRPGEGMVGYPTFAKLSDNEVYVVFYTQNMRGTVCIPGTCIAGNLLRIPE